MNTVMYFFVNEYEGPQQGLRRILEDELNNLLTTFDREQAVFLPETRLDYARKNLEHDQSARHIINLFDDFIVPFGIHQDSERDIFLCLR